LRVSLAGDHIRTITERGVTKADLLAGLNGGGVEVSGLAVGEPSLEDVFLSLAA
jgi:hypothetical protein